MRLLLLVPLLCSRAVAQSVKSCGGPNDHLKNPIIKLTPDPPVKGGSLTIVASGTLDEAEGAFNANVDLSIKAFGVVSATMKGAIPMSISPSVVKGPFSLTIGPISIPSSSSGGAMAKGQVTVVNGKNEPIMCIALDLDVPSEDLLETPAAATEVAETSDVADVSSCGKATDHVPDFKLATAGGVYTMTGTLDEDVTKASIALDAKLKALFFSVPIKMTLPLDLSAGLISKGAIKSSIGPSTVAISSEIHPKITGTMKINDGSNQEIVCLNIDGVIGREQTQEVVV